MTMEQLLFDESVPLCFDTNAIFGKTSATDFLESIRRRFPARRLLIPAWVVAERGRQLKIEYGEEFDSSMIETWLKKPSIKAEVLAFDQEVALGGWLDVVGRFQNSEWSWTGQPLSEKRPCAERCRTGDHIIHALALTHGALLVTNDKGLLSVAANCSFLGAIEVEQLKTLLDFHDPSKISHPAR